MNRYIAGLTQVSTALAISLGCYLVSAHVAAERAGVAQLRVEIARDAEAMRALDAELHTRARLPQLQSWNDSALLMSAPAPVQILAAPAQLVAYLPNGGGAAAVQAVAREHIIAPGPLPTAEAPPPAAPIMAAQMAVRTPALADARPVQPVADVTTRRARTDLASADDRPARALAPATRKARGAAERGAIDEGRAKTDSIAELAARAPKIDPTTDVADLTSAIGRELKADTSTRRVSLR